MAEQDGGRLPAAAVGVAGGGLGAAGSRREEAEGERAVALQAGGGVLVAEELRRKSGAACMSNYVCGPRRNAVTNVKG